MCVTGYVLIGFEAQINTHELIMYLEGSDTAGQGDGGEGKVIKDRGRGDFPRGAGAKTLPSHCRGSGFSPWLGK